LVSTNQTFGFGQFTVISDLFPTYNDKLKAESRTRFALVDDAKVLKLLEISSENRNSKEILGTIAQVISDNQTKYVKEKMEISSKKAFLKEFFNIKRW